MDEKMKRINLKFPHIASLAAVGCILISSCSVQMPTSEQTDKPSSAAPVQQTEIEPDTTDKSETDSSNYEKKIIGEWYGEMTYESGSTSVVI